MKKMTLTLALLLGAPMALFADVSKEELKRLAAAGISEGVILSYVRANGPMATLSPEDLIELKNAGVKESLLAAVLSIPRPAPRPLPSYVPPPNVYSTLPSYNPSVGFDDLYQGADYSGDWGYSYPSFGLGFGYYGGRYCGGYYRNRLWNGYSGGRVYGGHSGFGGFHGGAFGGGHGSFGSGSHGGGGGGGHAGGGGHR